MPGVEIGLGAYSAAATTAQLAAFIIRTCQDAKRLPKECQEIQRLVALLQTMLQKQDKALKKVSSLETDLKKSLADLLIFVVHCGRRTSFLQRAWEVAWERKLPALLNGLKDYILFVILEASLNTSNEQSEILERQKIVDDLGQTTVSLLKSLSDNIDGERTFLEDETRKQASILEDLRDNISSSKSQVERGKDIKIDFVESDSRLQVSTQLDGTITGYYQGIPVVCHRLNADMSTVPNRHRIILVYSKITENTLVHPLYGIAELRQFRYAVMQDLRNAPTLFDALRLDAFADESIRLQVAYDLAKAVAYLHSVNIVIRNISDRDVKLIERNGSWKPILINLERSRLFLEDTIGDLCDIRFEAPEFASKKSHSFHTDIWSLGVLLQEWIGLALPYGESEPTFADMSADNAKVLRTRVQSSHGTVVDNPPEVTSSPFTRLRPMLESCCSRNPLTRPSAAYLAEILFIVQATHGMEPMQESFLKPEIKQKVGGLLEKVSDKNSTSIPQLSLTEKQELKSAADAGDPVACHLLGRGIWTSVVDISVEKPGNVFPPAVTASDTETRGRAALEYLCFAHDAGVKEATVDMYAIHVELARLYKRLREEVKEAIKN